MCGIFGIIGQNNNETLNKMHKSLKHRGPNNYDLYTTDPNSKLEMSIGHNLLSIIGSNEIQPITYKNYILSCNGEIYNYDYLNNNILNNPGVVSNSDCEIIIHLYEYYLNRLSKTEDNLPFLAIRKVINDLEGDYAFCFSDGENYILARDNIGVKPLYFSKTNDHRLFFSSEKKGLWSINIDEINRLKPGHIIYNGEIFNINRLFQNLTIKYSSSQSKSFNYLKNKLKNNIINSTKKRINKLKDIGLIFSGGVDSTILAQILKNENIKTKLYCVGSKESSDLKYAKKAADSLDMELETLKINEKIVKESLKPVLESIEEFNIMKLGVAIPIYLSSKMASNDNLKVVLSGQGADELFGGYYKYQKFYSKHGLNVQNRLLYDIMNMYHVNLERDDAATMKNSVELRVPYLDEELIKTSFKIPVEYKFHKHNDLRKYILRQVALDLQVPNFIANRPKKAAQYGSGVNKILIKKILPKIDKNDYIK